MDDRGASKALLGVTRNSDMLFKCKGKQDGFWKEVTEQKKCVLSKAMIVKHLKLIKRTITAGAKVVNGMIWVNYRFLAMVMRKRST